MTRLERAFREGYKTGECDKKGEGGKMGESG
jgi:ribosome modulation factor